LTLDENGQERPGSPVDEAVLLEQPRIDVIEQQAGASRQVD
jgi:hypothetical protein